jgi:hypothetical protein
MVLLGGCNIESKIDFLIWSVLDGGVMVVDGGSDAVPLVTFSLLGLPSGVSYVVVRVVKYIPLNM